MRNVKKKILKRARSMPGPVKKEEKQGMRRLRIGYIVGLAALILARKRRRAKRPARGLRNKQGVGPAHIKGVTRGEEAVRKHPHKDDGHKAGPLIGSIRPK
jgi:hypothetical protein